MHTNLFQDRQHCLLIFKVHTKCQMKGLDYNPTINSGRSSHFINMAGSCSDDSHPPGRPCHSCSVDLLELNMKQKRN